MSRSNPKSGDHPGEEIIVAPANEHDASDVIASVCGLLGELRGDDRPADPTGRREVFDRYIDGRQPGVILVARCSPRPDAVGVLVATWFHALRAGGEVAQIQELWTDPAHRSRGIGAALVGALQSLAKKRGVASIEVGIPSPRFAGFDATERFYQRVGFVQLGPRLRLTVTDSSAST